MHAVLCCAVQVTPWNLEKLRAAVIAGPGRNPGAVAVEDEYGRVVMLGKEKKVLCLLCVLGVLCTLVRCCTWGRGVGA